MKPTAVFLSAVLLAGATPLAADSPAADDIAWRIRREALEHSQIMKTLHMLTDVYGPRLTGSPNLKQAGEWAAGQMKTWGMANTHLEPWNFGHPGWLNERFSAFLVSPVKDSLVGEVLAWTPSTNGPVKAATVKLTPPDRPSADALKTYSTASATPSAARSSSSASRRSSPWTRSRRPSGSRTQTPGRASTR